MVKKKTAQQTLSSASVTSGAYQPNTNNNNNNNKEDMNVTFDSVYHYYYEEVFPAIYASLPILLGRLFCDTTNLIQWMASKFLHFLLPKHWAESVEDMNLHSRHYYEYATSHYHELLVPGSPGQKLAQLWDQAIRHHQQSNNNTVSDFLLRHFDSNHDGSISAAEMLNLTQALETWHATLTRATPPVRSWYEWVSREWPMMDWKVGVFLWRSFGGIILTLCVLSIIPGRLHGISARILRWPVLAVTYFLIAVELFVYIVIRMGIFLAELIVAKPKHRKLRREIRNAKSYEEWYQLAAQLDKSQKRDIWQRTVDPSTSKRYNWSFITELMEDMKLARESNDSLLALAVLQQCTRKNVGGIMSEDLFSYTHTGEPMHIVRDFIQEVKITMEWVTDEALKLPPPDDSNEAADDSSEAKRTYEETLHQKTRIEKDKLWKSLIRFATTMSFEDNNNHKPQQNNKPNHNTMNTEGSVASLESMSEEQQKDMQTKINQQYASVVPGSPRSNSATNRLHPSIHRKQVTDFFKRARTAYGRTALCLSGGSTMGSYHFGHIRGLLEAGVLPNIISGTSAGSVVGAVICTRTDEEILRDMRPEIIVEKLVCFSRSWPERMKSLAKNGHMFSFDEWLELIKWFTMGDMTFEEAYQKTGRLFCITVSATTKKAPPVLLNHLSAPNVTLASAIIASAAVPGFVPPVKLHYKLPSGHVCENFRDQTYFDGSIDSDIPVNGLAEMLNCQFFVAAQCNPHIVPFFFNPKGAVGRPSRWSSGRHEHSWRGGFLLATLEMYLKNDMKAKFKFLHDMEASVGFTSTLLTQEYHGTTTLVPQVHWIDYTKLFSNLNLDDMYRHFQGGSIAAYEHVAMIKTHYCLADALDNCLEALRTGKRDKKNEDRSILRIPLARYQQPPPHEICTDVGTISTHSSLHDDDDDHDTCPSKWEEIGDQK